MMVGLVFALGFLGLAVLAVASLGHSLAGSFGLVKGLQAELAAADRLKTYIVRDEDLIVARALPARRTGAGARAVRRPVITPTPDRLRVAA